MRIKMPILAKVVLLFLLPLLANAQSSIAVRPIGEAEQKALFPSRAMLEFGRTVAETNCAQCHGIDGLSDAEGKPQLAGQRTVYLYRVLQAFQAGVRTDISKNHKTFLNDEAILSTAVYYSGLTPVQVTRETGAADGPEATQTTEENEVSEPVEKSSDSLDDPFYNIRPAMKRCVKCHGADGNAGGSGMPNLTAQDPEYFVTSMLAYVDGSRNHRLMKRLVGALDETTLKEMGVFYAVQEPQQTQTLGEGDVNVGRRLSEPCAACHGVDGNAKNPAMPTLAGQDAKYFIKAMKHYKDGSRKHQNMFEAVEALSEQDIIDMASYYASEVPRRRDVRMPLKSTEWIARCERCHGIDGNSSDPRFPMLAGQDETYLRNSLEAYANGARENTAMYAMAAPLSALDVEHIAAYFAAQQPRAAVYMRLPCGEDQQ